MPGSRNAPPSKKRHSSTDPDPIDVIVGANMRSIRLQRGLSQQELGRALGITFQQIQKYEKGTNRLSASRMVHMAGVLGVRPEAFLQGTRSHPSKDQKKDAPPILAVSSRAQRIALAFDRLPAEKQKVVAAVLDSFASESEAADPDTGA